MRWILGILHLVAWAGIVGEAAWAGVPDAPEAVGFELIEEPVSEPVPRGRVLSPQESGVAALTRILTPVPRQWERALVWLNQIPQANENRSRALLEVLTQLNLYAEPGLPRFLAQWVRTVNYDSQTLSLILSSVEFLGRPDVPSQDLIQIRRWILAHGNSGAPGGPRAHTAAEGEIGKVFSDSLERLRRESIAFERDPGALITPARMGLLEEVVRKGAAYYRSIGVEFRVVIDGMGRPPRIVFFPRSETGAHPWNQYVARVFEEYGGMVALDPYTYLILGGASYSSVTGVTSVGIETARLLDPTRGSQPHEISHNATQIRHEERQIRWGQGREWTWDPLRGELSGVGKGMLPGLAKVDGYERYLSFDELRTNQLDAWIHSLSLRSRVLNGIQNSSPEMTLNPASLKDLTSSAERGQAMARAVRFNVDAALRALRNPRGPITITHAPVIKPSRGMRNPFFSNLAEKCVLHIPASEMPPGDSGPREFSIEVPLPLQTEGMVRLPRPEEVEGALIRQLEATRAVAEQSERTFTRILEEVALIRNERQPQVRAARMMAVTALAEKFARPSRPTFSSDQIEAGYQLRFEQAERQLRSVPSQVFQRWRWPVSRTSFAEIMSLLDRCFQRVTQGRLSTLPKSKD